MEQGQYRMKQRWCGMEQGQYRMEQGQCGMEQIHGMMWTLVTIWTMYYLYGVESKQHGLAIDKENLKSIVLEHVSPAMYLHHLPVSPGEKS